MKFVDVFRFKADCTTINNGEEIEKSYKEFHPPKPDLKKRKILVFPRDPLLILE